jgi:hypothetical protein
MKKKKTLKLHRETLHNLSLTAVVGGITRGLTCDSCDGVCSGDPCAGYSGPVYCSNQAGCDTYAVCDSVNHC